MEIIKKLREKRLSIWKLRIMLFSHEWWISFWWSDGWGLPSTFRGGVTPFQVSFLTDSIGLLIGYLRYIGWRFEIRKA